MCGLQGLLVFLSTRIIVQYRQLPILLVYVQARCTANPSFCTIERQIERRGEVQAQLSVSAIAVHLFSCTVVIEHSTGEL